MKKRSNTAVKAAPSGHWTLRDKAQRPLPTTLNPQPLYVWVCHSCHASNPADSVACGACGCPAVASVADIAEAKTGVKPAPRLSRKQWQAQRCAEIAVLPFWKKLAAYALQAMRVVGAVFILSGIFDFSVSAGLFGLGIVLVAEVLFSRLKGRPYVWESS